MVGDLKAEMVFEIEKLHSMIKRASKVLEDDENSLDKIDIDENGLQNGVPKISQAVLFRQIKQLQDKKYIDGILERSMRLQNFYMKDNFDENPLEND